MAPATARAQQRSLPHVLLTFHQAAQSARGSEQGTSLPSGTERSQTRPERTPWCVRADDRVQAPCPAHRYDRAALSGTPRRRDSLSRGVSPTLIRGVGMDRLRTWDSAARIVITPSRIPLTKRAHAMLTSRPERASSSTRSTHGRPLASAPGRRHRAARPSNARRAPRRAVLARREPAIRSSARASLSSPDSEKPPGRAPPGHDRHKPAAVGAVTRTGAPAGREPERQRAA
jgi:hypothetical protein